jgi:hypothetical protein
MTFEKVSGTSLMKGHYNSIKTDGVL